MSKAAEREFRADIKAATDKFISAHKAGAQATAPASAPAESRPSPNRLLASLDMNATIKQRLVDAGYTKVGQVVKVFRDNTDRDTSVILRDMGLSPAHRRALRKAIGV